jgi:DNA-binding NarL/FixJ family response regulator
MSIRVFLADDQELVRGGFAMLISSAPDMSVVGGASDGLEAVDGLRALAEAGTPADVALMDIRMPNLDGVEATRRIVAAGLTTRVLVLTTFDLDEYVFSALKAGASGFLLKGTRPADLLSAIRSVAAGDSVVAPSATRRLLAHVVDALPDTDGDADSIAALGAKSGPDPLDCLTEREREVLVEIAKGATNAEICERLFMAEGTVKTHVGHLLSKLGARDRVGLVLVAYENRLVSG